MLQSLQGKVTEYEINPRTFGDIRLKQTQKSLQQGWKII